MTKIIPVVIAIILLGGAMLAHSVKKCWIMQYATRVQALWHDDECYFVVGVNTLGWSGSYLEEAWLGVRSALGLPTPPQSKLREDIQVFHYVGGRLNKFYLRGFVSSATLTPYQGIPHAFVGAMKPPLPVWRWTGSDFIRLDDAEAKQIRNSFTWDSELLAREGWSKNDLLTFQPHVVTLPIKLKDTDLTLNLRTSTDQKKKLVSLSGAGLKEPEEIIWELDETWRSVDQQTYLSFTLEPAGR